MQGLNQNDTICAIATSAGEAGIGIVRLSGKEALKIADKIFIPKNGKKPSEMPGYTLHYGHVKGVNNKIIDEVLLSIMRAPKSYTKEDVIEINAHGGVIPLREILQLVVSKGARPAEPGEFTKRAFLNGRIDLSQAEAVLDIITAKTESSLNAAKRQLDGELSASIKDIRSDIIGVHAEVEASLDFTEEDLELLKEPVLGKKLDIAVAELKKLLKDYPNGKVLREGVTTVICGKPNVGKSTLMNRFLKHKRVIVTATPGTTRDAIEEIVNVRGIPLKIVDTAGVMHTDDEPSMEGVRRSKEYMESADLILLVLDSSDALNNEDINVIETVREKKVLVLVNKTDLPARLKIEEIKRYFENKKIIKISAKKDKNLDKLYNIISDSIWSGEVSSSNQPVLTNVRHEQAIKESIVFLENVIAELSTKGKELIAMDLKEAINKLGLITGENFTEYLLDEIFSRFCIGK